MSKYHFKDIEIRGLQWLDTGHYRKKPPQFGYNPYDWNPLMAVAQHQSIVAKHEEKIAALSDALKDCADWLDWLYNPDHDDKHKSNLRRIQKARAALALMESAK